MAKWSKDELFRKQARKVGYRSRAAFKLLEINQRFKILKYAKRIVDLCCAPGSWLQVIKELCETHDSRIVGIDMEYVKPIPGVNIIRSTIEDPELISSVMALLEKPAHLVLSDCSPKLTGNKNLDRERQLEQAKLSFTLACQLLAKNGHFVTKVFQKEELRDFIAEVKQYFKSVKTFKPSSSFKRSPEMYLIAKGFLGEGDTSN